MPLGYQTKFITDPNTSKPGKYHFPRIGSFEVYFRGFIIFSKIQTVKWPLPSLIANKIKEIQDSPNENLRNKKKERAKRVKSAAPGKKKKVKKGKKKFGKLAKPKSNYYNLEKSQDKESSKNCLSNVSDIYKHEEIPNFSADLSQQSVPPKDYYISQFKPGNKEMINNQEKNEKKTPFYEESNKNGLKKDPSPLRVSDLEIKNNFRSESANNFTSFDKYTSSDHEDNHSGIANFEVQPYALQKMEEKTDSEESYKDDYYEHDSNMDDSNSYDSEKYDSDDQDEEKYEEKHQKDEKVKEKPHESEEENSYDDEYEKDSEKYSEKDSEKYSEKDSEKYSEKDSDKESVKYSDKESEKYSDKESEKESKKFSNKEDDSNENYSEDHESEEYDASDFEEEDPLEEAEKVHPLREVNKSYNVSLPLAVETKKKITYQNLSDADASFVVESSNPDFMDVKESEISIKKGMKGKIKLRFAPVFNDEEKKYYLYINRNGQPWECIEIIAEYQDNS